MCMSIMTLEHPRRSLLAAGSAPATLLAAGSAPAQSPTWLLAATCSQLVTLLQKVVTLLQVFNKQIHSDDPLNAAIFS